MTFLRLSNLRQCSHVIPLVGAVLLTVMPALSALAADSTEQSVIGRWKLKAALDSANITSLDDSEAQQLVGHTLTINKKQFKFGKHACASPGFESERVEPRLYLREHYRASASQLGLPNPVTVVHLECTSAFIKNRNRLVIFWDGWFFDAVRIKK